MALALANLLALNVIVSRTPFISKTKFLHGLQCPKLLWSDYNAKHLFPDVDDALQAVFDQGHEIGALAKKMFPNGIEIDADPTDFEGAIELTKKAISSRVTIFEATLSANGGFARVDMLSPVGENEWDIIEVKSTTSLKDAHIPDLAFQAWVFTEAGIDIRRCYLCHINNQFVRHGEIDPKEFFTLRDITAEVSAYAQGAVLNFGNGAACDIFPAGILQPVGQIKLRPVEFVTAFADLTPNKIPLFHCE